MTKDHVLVGRVGSSPILRMSYRCCIDDEIGCTAFSYFKENERGDYDKKGITFKTKLNTPVLKKAVSKSYNSIMLSWEKVDGAQKYEVYRKIGGTG